MSLEILIFLIILNIIFLYFSKFFAKILNLIDYPDQKRKIHKIAVPKIGGIVFFINILIVNNIYLTNTVHENFAIFLNIFLPPFFLLYYLDDIFDLRALTKSIIFCIIIIFFNYFFEDFFLKVIYFSFLNKKINLLEYSVLINVICFFLLVNSFNMTDGIDGLAITIYSAWIIIFLIIIKDNVILNFIYMIIPFVIIFLIFNLKNYTFLGNTGSHLLPIFLGSILIYSNNLQINLGFNEIIKSDIVFLVFLLPGLDLVRLFFLRVFIKKTNFYKADNEHLHHYLSKKFGLYKTNLIFIIIILVPNIISVYNSKLILPSIIFTLILYFYLINRNRKPY